MEVSSDCVIGWVLSWVITRLVVVVVGWIVIFCGSGFIFTGLYRSRSCTVMYLSPCSINTGVKNTKKILQI